MTDLPKRKSIRIRHFDYAAAGAYFITVCTADRKNIFWDDVGADIIRPSDLPLSAAGQIAKQGVLQIAAHYQNVVVDTYCIMPDHIHLILQIRADDRGRMVSAPTVSTIVGSMKRWVSQKLGHSVWQKSFYEHGIRSRQDYDEIWTYIQNNPLAYPLK